MQEGVRVISDTADLLSSQPVTARKEGIHHIPRRGLGRVGLMTTNSKTLKHTVNEVGRQWKGPKTDLRSRKKCVRLI